MTVQPEFEYLRVAFAEMGCECAISSFDETARMAEFVVQKGETTAVFKASSVVNRNPLFSREMTFVVEAEEAKMRFPFGHKNPDGKRYRFFMTGLNRAEGEDPRVFCEQQDAKKIATKIWENLEV